MSARSELAAALAWANERKNTGAERKLGDALAEAYVELNKAASEVVAALCDGCQCSGCQATGCEPVAKLRTVLEAQRPEEIPE